MSSPKKSGAVVDVETDPRFPSGKWTGFWFQSVMGRRYMSIDLTFQNNKIVGRGFDCVGEFVMGGDYDLKTGSCRISKGYIGQHTVSYEGRNEDDGMWIWGLWEIRSLDRGGFHMWPAGENDPTGRRLHEEKELPHSQQRIRVRIPETVGE